MDPLERRVARTELADESLQLDLVEIVPLDDGAFEVSLFRAGEVSAKMAAPRVGLMARYLTEMQLKLQELDPGVINLSGKRVIIETWPKMPCHTDGEWAGYTPLTCEIRPLALRLLAPAPTTTELFSRPGIPLADLV